jgi:hypothetical protein
MFYNLDRFKIKSLVTGNWQLATGCDPASEATYIPN